MSIELTDEIKYTVERSKRKSVGIVVERTGAVRVLAPKNVSLSEIQRIVMQKQSWIRSKLHHVSFTNQKKNRYKDTLPYMGSEIEKIKVSDNKALERWYREQAKVLINERVAFWGHKMGRFPSQISVKAQKSRWGSCTSNGQLLLNWRLILAPIEVIDYVIIHELAHLYQMNHSKAFWSIVDQFDPHFKEKRRWLKQNSWILDFLTEQWGAYET